MIEITEGIVLRNSDYQEKSKILQVFTKEHGLIGIFLKGANNYKSNNYLLAQPITHASFNINYREGLSGCYTGETLNSFQNLKLDVEKNLYVFHLFELILKNFEGHQPNAYIYELLLNMLLKIDETKDFPVIKTCTNFFELKFLYFIGLAPNIDNCVECGSPQDIVNFDIARGGFVCRNCQDRSKRIYSIDALKYIYELFYSTDINKLPDINCDTLKEIRELLNDYYLYHLGFNTNSVKYLT